MRMVIDIVQPSTREHDTTESGVHCWCGPTFFVPCDECDAGCWKCTDGAIPLTKAEAVASDRAIVVVHNAE